MAKDSRPVQPTILLTGPQARALTDEIASGLERVRTAKREVWRLIEQAYEGRAWEALGYKSWSAYVAKELDLAESQAYLRLTQATVIRALQSAARLPPESDVRLSARKALQVRSVLPEVVDTIKKQTKGKREAARAEVVSEVIAETSVVKPQVRATPARELTVSESVAAMLAVTKLPAKQLSKIPTESLAAIVDWGTRFLRARNVIVPSTTVAGGGPGGDRLVTPRFKNTKGKG